jgi:hypothetical protein
VSAAQTIPGPWEVSDGAIWGVSPWNARVRIAQVTHFSPMNGIDSAGHERQIAAAPEMLIALQGLLHMLETDDGDEVQAWKQSLANARAAIAKATGSAA